MPKVSKPTHSFTHDEIIALRQVFDAIDTDGSGELDLDEFTKFMKDAGAGDAKDAKMAMFLFDSDHNGTISWNEFVSFMDAFNDIEAHPEKLFQLIFKAIDLDNSGSLDKKEVKQVGELFGESISDAEIDEMFAALDSNNDGQLTYAEIIRAFTQ